MSSIGATPSARRVGGYERVTGSQVFVGDVRLENMLHLKLVTLDCARARIDGVDTEAALRVPGVRLVVTAADLGEPVPRYGPVFRDRPPLAVDETKFHGEPVAAVVAETEEAADEAARLVHVHAEELPAVLTVEQALDPSCPLVQDPKLRRPGPLAATNVLQEWDFGWGEVPSDAADRAHVVVENTYRFPMITHFAIEPHAFLAAPTADGLTVWSPVQHPFALQEALATLLGLPLAKVRVIAPDPGGAFGGKQHAKFEPLVALLALRLGRPVRLALTLEQTFQAVRRTAWRIHARTGFSADGRLVFQDIDSCGLLGAYADIAPRVISKSSYLTCGPYRVTDARVHVRALLSHTPPATAFRGFGTPQVAWAVESQMDEAARRLGMGALELRLANLARYGEEVVRAGKPADGHWEQAVRRAAELVGWGTPLPEGHGRGLACGIKASATTGASYAIVRLHYDGSATVLAATSDMGQGARTVLAQVAGHELGIETERVAVVMGDTGMVPFDLQTSASRSTVFMGTAVQQACRDVKAKLAQMAVERCGAPAGSVEVGCGSVRTAHGEESFADFLVRAFAGVRGEVIGVGSRRGESVQTHPLGGDPAFYEFNCSAVEVAVDRETGELLVVRHVSVGDVGKALNPAHVAAQDEGAAIMGLGHTLMEHVLLDERGRIQNLGALDYRIPTTKDVALEMHTAVVENEDGPGPYGSKGAGEGGLLVIAPAVAAAVAEATGAVIRDLPLTPERIWTALQEGETQQSPSTS